jgi:class I fructose-bisphosphate aldolase
MGLGKQIRLNRIFAHPSGRLCSVAVDHLIGYPEGFPPGLRHIIPTVEAIVAAKPDALTMHKGIATSIWPRYAGTLPFIVQSTMARVDLDMHELIVTPEEAVRLGADAIACGE